MRLFPAILLTAAFAFCESKKVVIGKDTLAFHENIDEAANKKRVKFRSNLDASSPFNRSLSYDSSQIKIFGIYAPETPADTLQFADLGILSDGWGVQLPQGTRYLNITDLKKISKRPVDLKVLQSWIIGGKRVKASSGFRNFLAELKLKKIVTTSFPKNPKDFSVSDTVEATGFRKFSGTFMFYDKFIKFTYLVSEKNEVMLLNKEVVLAAFRPNTIAYPGMSFVVLENPKDSIADRNYVKYSEILQKYDRELFN